jgi:4-amino-4-deoxy-L-arabinose transferase-like glycosyltransferase
LQPIWYYVPIVLGGFVPGTIFIVPYLRGLLLGKTELAANRTAAGGFWLLAGGWCLLFFSISGSKLPTYILPAFPFLSLALGEFIARSAWNHRLVTKVLIAVFTSILLFANMVLLPKYARERSPFGNPEAVEKYLSDPNTVVVSYPRNCDSLAFYTNRSDFDRVRSKGINQLLVDMHHRPRTVILFTHRHSLESFQQALPDTLEVAEAVNLRRPLKTVWDKLTGNTPWGLADIAVIVPSGTVRAQKP